MILQHIFYILKTKFLSNLDRYPAESNTPNTQYSFMHGYTHPNSGRLLMVFVALFTMPLKQGFIFEGRFP